ncbi:MAG: YfhO family protein [Bacteroidaceae bacterium]|nr:YfhO family protein [Bacteroidaceae bacterium]
MKFDFKKLLPDAVCIVLFIVISFAYFSPAVFDGRRLEQHDSGANDGINVEIKQYRESHNGETPRWNTSLFGGMPTYQIAPSYNSTKTMAFIEKAYHLWLPDYVWYIFVSMLGFYILLRAFDFRQWMAALGAIIWAFSSYFFIIIAAGHIWKVMTLAYIPPTMAGMVLCYKRKYVWGGILLALFAALQISANHVQMTYYFILPEVLMVLAFLVEAIRKRQLAAFCKGTVTVGIACVLAVCLNLTNLYHTYEYQKETMRGKSELVKQHKTEDQTDTGLERSYITAWSYGVDETMTFIIPNYRGGASMPLSMNKTAMKKADPRFNQAGIYGAFTQYWGEQPGTSGPVYLGAIVCMLFVLSLFLIPNKRPMKWALLLATVITLMLSWGHNFMAFTDFAIDHVPMYAKFRTVASILVVVEFTVPLMAMWGLKLYVEKPNQKALFIATGITVGICLLLMFFGGDCLSTNDRNAINSYVGQGYFDAATGQQILSSISEMRMAMLTSDGWRSIIFILLGAAVLFWYGRAAKQSQDLKAAKPYRLITVVSLALLALCLVDMWPVNKRYLYDQMFVYPQGVDRIQKTEADDYILSKSGTGRDYRVLNFTVSTFNDNTTSAFYSSVGGYHAAKLRRYQELIETHIAPEMSKVYEALRSAPMDTVAMMTGMAKYPVYDFAAVNTDSLFPVINMLNTRWFILGAGEGGKTKMPIENNTANGNAWFVTDVKYVDNANEEIDQLGKVNLKHTAVVAKADFGFLKAGGEGTASLTEYGPVEAKYTVDSQQGGLVIFSEVYYPGWTATIDGQPAEVGRANYVLRALNVPAGKHEVVFTYNPQSIHTTEMIAYIALGVLLLGLLVACFLTFRKRHES